MEQRKTIMEKITDRVIYGNDTSWNMDIERFDWGPGVGLYGIWKAWQATGKEEYLRFLEKWINRHLKEAYVQKTVNSTAPLLTVLTMWEQEGNEAWLRVCEEIAAFLLEKAPRTKDGGLEHTVTEAGAGFSQQMWADTLFMVCVFMARLGRVTGDLRYIAFSRRQLADHLRVLRDEETGLYFHAWDCAGQNHMSGVRWGRANAWILYSTALILSAIEGTEQEWRQFAQSAAAMRAVQREHGAFGTILNDPSSYDEISATAGIAAGMALGRSCGVLGREYDLSIEKALQAVSAAVGENGEVGGVSGGTPVMPSAEAYRTIRIQPTLYGQGLAAAALAEAGRGKTENAPQSSAVR